MPTYRSITISIVSQLGILNIPEYAPPEVTDDPFTDGPTLLKVDQSLVTVYIPTYPSARFWINYSISPPFPPKLLFYFKLYSNGNLITSWGCGKESNYRGRTMFDLCDSGYDLHGRPVLERRVLCFSPSSGYTSTLPPDMFSDIMEIRVYRSKCRRRIKPEIEEYYRPSGELHIDKQNGDQSGDGINLIHGGVLTSGEPQRYYKYALVDPLDQPYATFRYMYRSWEHLELLGVTKPRKVSPSSSSGCTSINSDVASVRPLSERNSNQTLRSSVREEKDGQDVDADPMEPSLSDKKEGPHMSEVAVANASIEESPDRTEDLSPLTVAFVEPTSLLRPPTPAASPDPSKQETLLQLPSPTNTTFKTNVSKESFASLIGSYFPSPDPGAWELVEPQREPPRPPTPVQVSRSKSITLLKNVVNSAKCRRKRLTRKEAGSETGSSKEITSSDDAHDGVAVKIFPQDRQTDSSSQDSQEQPSGVSEGQAPRILLHGGYSEVDSEEALGTYPQSLVIKSNDRGKPIKTGMET